MARAPSVPEKVQKWSKMSFFHVLEKFWYRKNFFGRIRGVPELPRIFRFLLGSATDDVREQNFGSKNPGTVFFSVKKRPVRMDTVFGHGHRHAVAARRCFLPKPLARPLLANTNPL